MIILMFSIASGRKVDKLVINKCLIIGSTLFGNRINVNAWPVMEMYLVFNNNKCVIVCLTM